MTELRARLDGATEKLRVLGQMVVLESSGNAVRPGVTIIRKAQANWDRIPASEDTGLMPGDTVEVVFRREDASTAAVQ